MLWRNLRNLFDDVFRREVAESEEMRDQRPHLRGSDI